MCGVGKYGIVPTIEAPGEPRGCAPCPGGYFCPESATEVPRPCPPGTVQPYTGATNQADCLRCGTSTVSASAANSNASCTTVCEGGLESNAEATACVTGTRGFRAAWLAGLSFGGALLLGTLTALALLRRRAREIFLEGLHSQLIELDSAQHSSTHPTTPRELLCMACSPHQTPLRKARAEIVEVADACQWGADRVTLSWGGNSQSLLAELHLRPTRRILFAGHTDQQQLSIPKEVDRWRSVTRYADVSATSRPCVLGFTRPGGGLEPIESDEAVGLFAPFFPISTANAPAGIPDRNPHCNPDRDPDVDANTNVDAYANAHAPPATHRVLELIFLNGCHSEALGIKLRDRGAPCVVCWRTAVRDDAARLFSVAFFRSLARLSAVNGEVAAATIASTPEDDRRGTQEGSSRATCHHSIVQCVQAFDCATHAMCSATRRSKRSVRKFALADPEAPRVQNQPRYPLAAGTCLENLRTTPAPILNP